MWLSPEYKVKIEVNPRKFLDMEIMVKHGIHETSKYKRNAILRDLHGAQKISSNFELEKEHIKKKYLSINFPYIFIQSAFNSYQQKCES